MTSVAVLGTGLLGTAIATRLLEQGLKVEVWNRDPSRLVPLVDKGATAIDEPAAAAGGQRVIITVLRDGAATTEVIGSIGPLHGSTVIPMGTMGVRESQNLAQHVTRQGGAYLEAPVLGSRPQALNGSLLVMAGGEAKDFNQQRELLKHLAEEPMLVGPVGSGAANELAAPRSITSRARSDGSSTVRPDRNILRCLHLRSLFIFTLFSLVMKLISDLTYMWVDPRIDFERRDH